MSDVCGLPYPHNQEIKQPMTGRSERPVGKMEN